MKSEAFGAPAWPRPIYRRRSAPARPLWLTSNLPAAVGCCRRPSPNRQRTSKRGRRVASRRCVSEQSSWATRCGREHQDADVNAYVPVGQRRYSPALRKATDVAPSVNPTPDVIPASSNHLWAPTVMLRRKAAATRRGRAVSQSRRHVWRDLWIVRGMTCSFSPPWVLCQPVQAGAHHLHGDALMIAVGGVEDVAGNQLDGLDHAHSTDRRPAMAGLQ